VEERERLKVVPFTPCAKSGRYGEGVETLKRLHALTLRLGAVLQRQRGGHDPNANGLDVT
jgi:hypothetical protein